MGAPSATHPSPADPRWRAPLSLPAEELLSWLAVEKGRSANTLAAYRRDLMSYESWLRSQGIDPASAVINDGGNEE